jgi:hypothetical protein
MPDYNRVFRIQTLITYLEGLMANNRKDKFSESPHLYVYMATGRQAWQALTRLRYSFAFVDARLKIMSNT